MPLPYTGPNAEQIRYWNETTAPKWVRHQARLDSEIGLFGETAMKAAPVGSGERVLDVGCGCGDTTLALARRVGERGFVLGIDVSEPMLGRARERVTEAGLRNVDLVSADAQTQSFPEPSFDLAFSRFGVMFFSNPIAAFANLRSAVRPGGRLAFVCWRAFEENEWLARPLSAAASVVPPPPPNAPGAPGPFSLADAKHVRAVLESAGWMEVDLQPVDETLALGHGRPFEETLGFLLEIGPTAALLREHGEEARARVATALQRELRPFFHDGALALRAAAWVVRATREAR